MNETLDESDTTQDIELQEYSQHNEAKSISMRDTLETSKENDDGDDSDEIENEISRLEQGDDEDTDEDMDGFENPDYEPTRPRGHSQLNQTESDDIIESREEVKR